MTKTRPTRVSPLVALILAGLGLLHGGPSVASPPCADLKGLANDARSSSAQPSNYLRLGGASGSEAECSPARTLSGGTSYHCAWKFPFRDDRARQAFAALEDTLNRCFPDHQPYTEEQDVNHPDTYLQVLHRSDGVLFSLSLKDKGAQQASYVFLGVSADTPD